jgi:adenylate kinase
MAPSLVFVILGPPGSGKTVQSRLLGKRYKIPVIAVSDLIKSEMGKHSRLADSLQVSVESGALVNDDAANELISSHLLGPKTGRGFVMDGYPLTESQARFFDDLLKKSGLPLPKVILLEVPDDVAKKRLLGRKRADDKPEIIDARIAQYRTDAQMLSSWYTKENVLRVDAGKPIADVAGQIDQLIAEALVPKTFKDRDLK